MCCQNYIVIHTSSKYIKIDYIGRKEGGMRKGGKREECSLPLLLLNIGLVLNMSHSTGETGIRHVPFSFLSYLLS